jgi:hypothetical protein
MCSPSQPRAAATKLVAGPARSPKTAQAVCDEQMTIRAQAASTRAAGKRLLAASSMIAVAACRLGGREERLGEG